MIYYIAGRITGNPDYKEEFERAAREIARLDPGAVILNPAVMPGGLSNAGYMRICFAMLDVAETVLFLPGSEKSDGAKLEEAYCRYTGKRTTTLLHMVLKKRLEGKSNGK